MLRCAKSLVSWIEEEVSSTPKLKTIKKTKGHVRRRYKNRNPFFRFLRKLRQDYPGLKAVELATLGGILWQRMNESEKNAYFNRRGTKQITEDEEDILTFCS